MRSLLLLSFIVIGACFAQAQNTINLSIEHYLQDQPFALEEASASYDGRTFDVSRMQYYVSEISITDEQGNVTTYDSMWTLVDASTTTDIDLGTGSMDSIVSITFFIGVDSAHNHLDPATYPSEHPLAFQNPSMHWGWANGYIFSAMGGRSGENLGQFYELHGLGDENYFSVTLPTQVAANNGELDITVYANYAEIVRGIDISPGLISHGPIYEAQTSLENIRDYVFSTEVPTSTAYQGVDTTDSNVSVGEISSSSFKLYPNPTLTGLIQIDRPNSNTCSSVVVHDAQGSVVWRDELAPSERSLHLDFLPAGVYQISLLENGAPIAREKLVKL